VRCYSSLEVQCCWHRGYAPWSYVPLIVGALLFLAPWVLGFSGLAAMARSSWIIGVLAFLTAGSTLMGSTTTDRRETVQ